MSGDSQDKIKAKHKRAIAVTTLFSQLSGIQTHFIPLNPENCEEPAGIFPCSFCTLTSEKADCISRLSAISTQMLTDLKSSLHVCPLGLCRIIVPVFFKLQLIGTVITEPLLCTEEKSALLKVAEAAETKKTERHFTRTEPAILYKTAKLLRLSLGCSVCHTEEEPERTKVLLARCIQEGNLLAARPLLDTILESMTDMSGTDFALCKNRCLEFFLCLEELMKDGALLSCQQDTESIFFTWLKADGLGKLKACINAANERFIAAAFCPLSQKHAALIQKAASFFGKKAAIFTFAVRR